MPRIEFIQDIYFIGVNPSVLYFVQNRGQLLAFSSRMHDRAYDVRVLDMEWVGHL